MKPTYEKYSKEHKGFVRQMRPVTLEEAQPWDYETNKHKLFNKNHRFISGPLLYQVNLFRQDKELSDTLFTMHPQDMMHQGTGNYIFSLHKIYMECSDPTEYAVAQKLFRSFKMWQNFIANTTVAPFVEELRDELKLKLQSEAMSVLRETMLTEGSKGTTAAKYLSQMTRAEQNQTEPGSNAEKWSRGRAAAGVEQTHTQIEDGFEEDIARLQLVPSSPKQKEA